jgi:hypothetical protein
LNFIRQDADIRRWLAPTVSLEYPSLNLSARGLEAVVQAVTSGPARPFCTITSTTIVPLTVDQAEIHTHVVALSRSTGATAFLSEVTLSLTKAAGRWLLAALKEVRFEVVKTSVHPLTGWPGICHALTVAADRGVCDERRGDGGPEAARVAFSQPWRGHHLAPWPDRSCGAGGVPLPDLQALGTQGEACV